MQQKMTKIAKNDFHAVEFMRQVREKLSSEYQKDKGKYLANAREAMKAFKDRQINTV